MRIITKQAGRWSVPPASKPTTIEGSSESMGNTNTAKLTLEEKKARQREAVRRYSEANKEKILERRKKYYLENKEKISKRKKEYNLKNKEKIAKRKKEYRRANLKKHSEQMQRWRKKNKEKHLEYVREYQKTKRRSDKVFHLLQCLRERQNKAIRKRYRNGSAVRDMGCTGQEACKYIESLFDEKMTWDNWGTYWQLDHIFPLSAANPEDRAEFLAVNNWRNLQPLEAKANLAKCDKVTPAARRLFNKLVKEFS